MKYRKVVKSAAALLLAAVLAGSAVLPVSADNSGIFDGKDTVTPDDGDYNVDIELPGKFDLRNVNGVNYVTPVRSQGIISCCWGFAACAASETSILYELINEQGLEVDPADLVMSPKHLAWFSHTPLPEDNEFYPTQAGEGGSYLNFDGSDAKNAIFTGGRSFTAASIFSMGIGPVYEAIAPFKNESGKKYYWEGKELCYAADGEEWIVDEDTRFMTAFEIEDCNNLPSPASFDTGQYTYNEDAEKVIKSELMNGRAVAVAYYGESVEKDKEGEFISRNYAHYTYRPADGNHVVCIVGWDDSYSRDNFLQGVDENGVSKTPPADGAWIVKNSWGREDAEFPDRDDFGVDGSGYFYLSYYDMTLSEAESFNYYTDNVSGEDSFLMIDQHDLMPTDEVYGLPFDEPQVMGNIFEVNTDEYLRAVSTETVLPDTTVTYQIYKLRDNAVYPTDGELMKEVSALYKYAGYHRTNLDEGIRFSEGDRYSVVVSEKCGDQFIIPIKYSMNKKYAEDLMKNEAYIKSLKDNGAKALEYSVGVVNRGESFFASADGNGSWGWSDWVDTIELIKYVIPDYDMNPGQLDFDNLPIKGYADPIDDEEYDSSAPDDSSTSAESKPDTDSSNNINNDTNPGTGAAAAGLAALTILAAAVITVRKRS